MPKRETQHCKDARQSEEPDCEADRLSSRGKRLPRGQQTPEDTTAGVAGLFSREIRPPGSQAALEYQTAQVPGLSSREVRLPGSHAVVEFQTAGWPGRLAGKSSSARFPPVCCSKPARWGTLRTTSPSLGLRPCLHRPKPGSLHSTLNRPDQGKSRSYSGSTTSAADGIPQLSRILPHLR